MNWLEFTSSVIDSLAWPMAAIVVLVVIRRPLAELIPALKELRYKGLEIGFGQRVEEAREAIDSSIPDDELEGEAKASFLSAISLASTYPRGAILEAWIILESAAISAAKRVSPEIPIHQLRIPMHLHNVLREKSLLTGEQTILFKELRQLRNAVVHAKKLEISEGEAADYVEACSKFTRILESVEATTT